MTLGQLLDETARRTPEAAALICGESRVSYAELSQSTAALAGWLLAQGLQPGDRVALHWANSIEIVQLYFACFKAGLIAVPVNQRLKAPEASYMLTHSETSLCFSQPELAAVAEEAVRLSGRAIPIVSTLPDAPPATVPGTEANEPCAILYTSGTTARPKGVTHTQASLLSAARLMLGMVGDGGPVMLPTTPMTHMSGLAALMLPCVMQGWTNVILPSIEPASVLDAIQAHAVTYSGALPALASLLVDEQIRRPRRTGSLRVFISGGDSVPLPLHEKILSVFGLPARELIAMTESCPIMWNTSDDVRAGSVGRPRNGVEVKLVPLIGGDSEVGEIAVRSPANFSGYWRDPEATAATIRDGWLYTGDLARRDEDGYYWFAGRLKQLIIRGGSNIAPQQVEDVLLQHPAVLEAGVIGLPDPVWGQRVGAFVSLREGCALTEDELQCFARQFLADYKVPETIWFTGQLPKGPTGKVDRRRLTSVAASQSRAPLQVQEAAV